MVHVPHVPQGVSCEESRAAMMQVPLPRAKRLSQLSLEASRVGKRARTGREVEVGLSARWKELQCSPATRGERAQHTCQHGPFLAAPAKRRDFRGKKAFRASGPVSVSAARRRLKAGAAEAPQGRRGHDFTVPHKTAPLYGERPHLQRVTLTEWIACTCVS